MTKKTTKRSTKRKTRKRTARTGWSVASAAGRLLAQIEMGVIVLTKAPHESRLDDITDRVERICASALRQREMRVRK